MATTSSSALDLLRPDPPIDSEAKPEPEEEEDELEALRQAALASMMKPKEPAFKVLKHPKNTNLLCIVVEDEKKPKQLKSVRELAGNRILDQPQPQPGGQRKDKFNRFESGSDESEEEEEEVETETEVEVTDSESEATVAPAAPAESSTATPKHDLSSATLNNDEDILNVDCREEVDEFSKFLNDFETELNDPPPPTNVVKTMTKKTGVEGEKKKTKVVKKKKLVKRMVKKRRGEKSSTTGTSDKLDTTQASSAPGINSRRSSESFSRSPTPPQYGRRYSHSPMSPYRRSPPMLHYRPRSRSPYRRGLSPLPYRRPYSPPQYRYGPPGSPPSQRPHSPSYRRFSPPGSYRRPGHLSPLGPYKRYPSPPRRPRSPRGPSIRFEQNNRNKFSRRGDSAPRAIPDDDLSEKQPQRTTRDGEERSKNDRTENLDSIVKSKSLPPAKNGGRSTKETREAEEKKKLEEKEEQKRLEFEERLRRLPTPDRERVLARRRKLESGQAVKSEKKVISLKNNEPLPEIPPPSPETKTTSSENVGLVPAKKVNRLISEDNGDAISLSVDDTLDMFEEEEDSNRFKRRGGHLTTTKSDHPATSRIGNRTEQDASNKGITDLRVQLYKKRQQTTSTRDTDLKEKRHKGRTASNLDDSHDKRHKARALNVDDSLENAEVDTTDDLDDGENIRSALSGNRIVKPPARDLDRRILVPSRTHKSRAAEDSARIEKSRIDESARPHKSRIDKSRSKSPNISTKFVVRNASPKSSSLKASLMARLGNQVQEEEDNVDDEHLQDVHAQRKRKKTNSSGRSESPKSKGDSPVKASKKDKKKDKKDKKKAKKEKKEKREKRKKRKSKVSSEEEEEGEDENVPAKVKVGAVTAKVKAGHLNAQPEVDDDKTGNSSDEELWGFFENMDKASPETIVQTDKTDILMDAMRRKNEARLKRIKEIEEDRRRHQ